MRIRLLLGAAASFVVPTTLGFAAQPPGVDRETIIGVLSAYHAALQAGEPRKVAQLLGPS